MAGTFRRSCVRGVVKGNPASPTIKTARPANHASYQKVNQSTFSSFPLRPCLQIVITSHRHERHQQSFLGSTVIDNYTLYYKSLGEGSGRRVFCMNPCSSQGALKTRHLVVEVASLRHSGGNYVEEKSGNGWLTQQKPFLACQSQRII